MAKRKIVLPPLSKPEPFKTISLRASMYERIRQIAERLDRSQADVTQALLEFALEHAEVANGDS